MVCIFLNRGAAQSSRIALAWNGELASGEVPVPVPGGYLLRFKVDSDQGQGALQRVVALAY